MKTKHGWGLIVYLTLLALTAPAQTAEEEKGFVLGIVRIRPELVTLGAYDNRVINTAGTTDDVYGQVEGLLRMDNTEARYGLNGWASYGYRAYDEFSEINDDFYGLGGKIASEQSSIKLVLSGLYKKTLDYDVQVDDQSGENLGAILTPETSTRSQVRFHAGYEKQITEKSALMPAYDGSYYRQDFESQPDAEWQEHGASLQWGYGFATKTVLTLAGGYAVQLSDEEDGSITSVAIGARSRATDKVDWTASLGVASVDYELSGTDEGVVGDIQVRWRATDKISAYLFGGNNYQPGYGGSEARRVYRAGYGMNWAALERMSMNLQILHDYQEGIQSGSGGTPGALGNVRHFFTGKVEYGLTKNVALSLVGQYISDEVQQDRKIVSLRAVLSY